MNIILIGYGKMGKMIEQLARAQGHTISAIVDPLATDAPAGIKINKSIADIKLKNIDASNPICAIEFTQPDTAVDNIIALAEKKIPTVTGTTGWHGRMNDVVSAVEKSNSSLIWASNFSVGINMFYQIAWHAARLMNNFSEYDAAGFETHHNKKMDSPSGTARVLAEGVLRIINRKKKVVWETMDRKPEEDEFHFPSLRLGSVPGTHSLFFDSPADTIEITHTARSREGFASGAIRAAKWLTSENRRGIFTIDDMMKDLFKE